ncbi:MAG: hypothetical protein WDN04_14970 [Rhodospirillales bacterium]
MSSESEKIFQADIGIGDNASKTIEQVRARLTGLADTADKAAGRLGHMHQPGVWAHLAEYTKGAEEKFVKLGESIIQVGEKVAELIPALGGLGAVTGLAGMFETVERTSEAFSKLEHTAQGLGLGTRELQVWQATAKLTDTDVEKMDKTFQRLNATLGEVASGKNKDATALLRHMHFDKSGVHSTTEALYWLADQFEKTTGNAKKNAGQLRTVMADTLVGKKVAPDFIAVMSKGSAALRKAHKEAEEVTFDMTPFGEGLKTYHDMMVKLQLATGAFGDELGAKLEPVLGPVVDRVERWVNANRDFVATKIVEYVQDLDDYVEAVDWDAVGDKFKKWAGDAGELGETLGSVKTALEVIAGISVASKIADVVALGAAWTGVAGGASGAAAAEGAALGAAMAGRLAALDVGVGIWSYKANSDAYADYKQKVVGFAEAAGDRANLAARVAALPPGKRMEFEDMERRHGFTPLSESNNEIDRERRSFWGASNPSSQLTAPDFRSLSQTAPAGAVTRVDTSGKADININITGLPAGAGANVQSSGSGIVGDTHVNTGRAFWDHPYGE